MSVATKMTEQIWFSRPSDCTLSSLESLLHDTGEVIRIEVMNETAAFAERLCCVDAASANLQLEVEMRKGVPHESSLDPVRFGRGISYWLLFSPFGAGPPAGSAKKAFFRPGLKKPCAISRASHPGNATPCRLLPLRSLARKRFLDALTFRFAEMCNWTYLAFWRSWRADARSEIHESLGIVARTELGCMLPCGLADCWTGAR